MKTLTQRSRSSRGEKADQQFLASYQEEREELILRQKVAYLATVDERGKETSRKYGVAPFLNSTLTRDSTGRWTTQYDYSEVVVDAAAAQVFKGLSARHVSEIKYLMTLIEGFADDAKQRSFAEKHEKYKFVLEQMNQRAMELGEEISRAIDRHTDDLVRAIRALHSVRNRKNDNTLLFLAISKAARHFGRVPTKQEVMRARGGRAHDGLEYDKTTFSKALKRIGFDWLPSARR